MKTLGQVAEEFGVKEITLVNEHKKGRLPIIAIGKQRFVEDADVQTWIASKRIVKPAKRKMSPEHKAKISAARRATKV